MTPSEADRSLDALLRASRNGDAASVSNIWRGLTPEEQEDLLFTLLEMRHGGLSGVALLEPDDRADPTAESPAVVAEHVADTAAMPRVDRTELIPKAVEDLRGLTGSERDLEVTYSGWPATASQQTGYWYRWRQRWRVSALAAAWAVTTAFLFTADTSTFGPGEWVVTILATVVGGGVLGGTLVDLVVAAIPTRARGSGAERG
ncbi:MAG: hypothetical protein ACJ71Z_09055 [Aeromicrobium sp.]